MKTLKAIIVIIPIVLSAIAIYAQKQSSTQTISVRAPDNVKVDGKMNEWPSPFLNKQNPEAYLSAYNSASRYFFTIANDDDRLYITLRGLGTRAARKVLEGGLIVTISHITDKKTRSKAADNVYITFPMHQEDADLRNIMGPIWTMSNYLADSVANRKQIDSLAAIANGRISSLIKEIKITGVKEIPDTLISIYNTEGIKAAFQFIKMMPVIELSIPLKYLKLSATNPLKFSYNIKLPGTPPDPNLNGIRIDPDPDTMYFIAATDFWGEYTLAGK